RDGESASNGSDGTGDGEPESKSRPPGGCGGVESALVLPVARDWFSGPVLRRGKLPTFPAPWLTRSNCASSSLILRWTLWLAAIIRPARSAVLYVSIVPHPPNSSQLSGWTSVWMAFPRSSTLIGQAGSNG